MASGKRNRKITIQRATTVDNDFGEPVPDWGNTVTLCSPYAQVIFGTGQERREAAQESATAAATFIVLHTDLTASVMATDRISFDGSYWDISANVPSLKLNRHREITATRMAP